jgi:hypothetical protein
MSNMKRIGAQVRMPASMWSHSEGPGGGGGTDITAASGEEEDSWPAPISTRASIAPSGANRTRV